VRSVVFLAVVAISVPARAEMMCESGPMPAQGVFTQTKVAGSGGVIIAGNKLPDWRFRDLNRVVRPRVTNVAPGLALYHPPPVADPDITLEDIDHAARVRKVRALKADPLITAPNLKRVVFGEDRSSRRSYVTVELAEAAPKSAVIAVILRVDGAKRIPLSWTQVRSNGVLSLPIWHTPFTCELHVDSLIPPKLGETVEVMWLDESGRISEPSNAVTIVRAKEQK
jgi:hypothetical protein